MEGIFSMRYEGNTGAYFTDPKTVLVAPENASFASFDGDTVTIREGGLYEIYMYTTCDTQTLGASLYGGFILQLNGDDQTDCSCQIPNSKYCILNARQVFEFNADDTLKIKNENGTVGSVCGHLYFQIKKIDL